MLLAIELLKRITNEADAVVSLKPIQKTEQPMKKTLSLIFLVAVASAAAEAQVISWNDNNGNTIPATGLAGVVAATNWNNSNPGSGGGLSAMLDNSNSTTTAGFTVTGTYGGWGIFGFGTVDGDATYNRTLLGGYANTASGVGPEVFSITGIPYYQYNLIAYFSSDTAGRTGTVACASAGVTNDFTTLGPLSVGYSTNSSGGLGTQQTTIATLTQTTDTTGANPMANYAVFTNLSGSSQTLTLSIPNGGGLAGFQIVSVINLPTLSLSADTTATPSTNVYVGSTVTFSASFAGTLPITNQWEVNTGGGFVPIAGATNSTLTLTNLQLADAGSYALFASNAAGSSNSTPVILSVSAQPSTVALDVQFTGNWLGSGNAPAQTGSAVIGNGGDVWNTFSNPTGSATVAGTARGTNLVLFDTGNISTPITMDYVADYVFNGTAFGDGNPFYDIASPYANLMSGYMGSVTTTTADTNTVTLHHLTPGIYDLYLYVCGRDSDGQNRVDVLFANDQTGQCGPNNGAYTLTPGVNFLHLTPTVTTNGVLTISFYGTTDAGQGLLNGFQLSGPATTPSLSLSMDTVCDSPLNDYVGRTVSFTAAFAGIPRPSLQWEVNKGSGFVAIAGATNSTLTLANLQITDSGSYALFATNTSGGQNSTPLTLNVQPLPSPLAVNVQFIGTSYGSGVATTQVGGAATGGGSDYWNPVSNPNPVGVDTNLISGNGLLLSDVNNYGSPLTLDYVATQDYNNGGNTPFNGSSSPAVNLMQASLVALNTNTATVTLHGIPAGVYDLYLYSCASTNAQQVVTRFSANDSFDDCGPNNGNNTLILGTNYVHLTPTVAANGILTISLVGTANGQGNLNGIQLSGPGATTTAPLADFTGTPTSALTGQPVVFTDASTGNITNWVWNFGDGQSVTNTSNANVSHAYSSGGAYTVSLTVTGQSGANTSTRSGYITVTQASVPVLSGPTLSNGNLILNGTGGSAGAQYRILTTTNLALPLASWTPVYTNNFAPDGSFGYTNSLSGSSASFFRVATP